MQIIRFSIFDFRLFLPISLGADYQIYVNKNTNHLYQSKSFDFRLLLLINLTTDCQIDLSKNTLQKRSYLILAFFVAILDGQSRTNCKHQRSGIEVLEPNF